MDMPTLQAKKKKERECEVLRMKLNQKLISQSIPDICLQIIDCRHKNVSKVTGEKNKLK